MRLHARLAALEPFHLAQQPSQALTLAWQQQHGCFVAVTDPSALYRPCKSSSLLSFLSVENRGSRTRQEEPWAHLAPSTSHAPAMTAPRGNRHKPAISKHAWGSLKRSRSRLQGKAGSHSQAQLRAVPGRGPSPTVPTSAPWYRSICCPSREARRLRESRERSEEKDRHRSAMQHGQTVRCKRAIL